VKPTGPPANSDWAVAAVLSKVAATHARRSGPIGRFGTDCTARRRGRYLAAVVSGPTADFATSGSSSAMVAARLAADVPLGGCAPGPPAGGTRA
jgi:hypothetical protein